PAVADIKAIDDGEVKGAGTLDNTSAHASYTVSRQSPIANPPAITRATTLAHIGISVPAMLAFHPSTKRSRCTTATIAKIITAAIVNGLFIACIDHLEREKRGWAGIKPRRPHFAFSAG